MDGRRNGAWALIAGAVLVVVVFAVHPSHAGGAPVVGPFTLAQLVHGTALVGVPLLAFGMWQMAELLGLERMVVRFGLILAGLAMALTANAAVVSNFMTPAAARASAMNHAPAVATGVSSASPAPAQMQMPPLVGVSVALNRGFAQVHVGYFSLALLLFGVGALARFPIVGWAGIAVGAYPVLWQLSGRFSPETTTMPWIAFPQAAWLMAMAIAMLRSAHNEASG